MSCLWVAGARGASGALTAMPPLLPVAVELACSHRIILDVLPLVQGP